MRYIFSVFCISFCFFVAAQNNAYRVWVDKAAGFIERNRFDSAVVSLQQAMKLDPANPGNPLLLLNLGILQRRLKLADDAYISFTAALAGSPDSAQVLHNRASLLCDLERFDEAMEDYSSLIEKHPTDVEAYYRRGLLFLEKNDRKRAEADFRTCRNIDSVNFFTRLSEALLFKLDDNWIEAEKIYTDIIGNEKEANPDLLLNRAECYVNSGRFSKAAADLYAIENRMRDNSYFYILRGRVRLDQFDKFAAKADFEKALHLGYDSELAGKWIDKTK